VDGTPLPPGAPLPAGLPAPPGSPASAQSPAPPPASPPPPFAPMDVPDAAAPPASPPVGGPQAAPSSFTDNGSRPGPSVAVTHYDPETGTYVGSDGQLYRQSNLVRRSGPKKWQDMLPT
jgi:phospholipid/cholesterol/gamma-HCH transport system substrate-binding protein